MNPVSTDAPQTFVGRIMHWLETSRERTAESRMIAALDDDAVQALARDCAVSEAQLLQLAKAGPHGADEMIAMLHALNIDPESAELEDTMLFRDMRINCSCCAIKAVCRQQLADGTAAQNFDHFCSNSEHLHALCDSHAACAATA